ncbi:hypothetical protein L3Y34_012510 [Caenorhabditis briggsae]|uniref:Uncharacterized protein n=1 Tax=Caenorhabditis briggsae TaxID=6238 RepID=A0AAE9CWP6_CAEBR|nr:hypothetical protein L3Y34_012510 [Caenorhabditis briggsae]
MKRPKLCGTFPPSFSRDMCQVVCNAYHFSELGQFSVNFKLPKNTFAVVIRSRLDVRQVLIRNDVERFN